MNDGGPTGHGVSAFDWQVLQFIERNGRLEQPQLCPNYIYQLMRRCWSYAPADRPTFSRIHGELQLNTNYENLPLKKARDGVAENAGVENAGVDSRSIATEKLSR